MKRVIFGLILLLALAFVAYVAHRATVVAQQEQFNVAYNEQWQQFEEQLKVERKQFDTELTQTKVKFYISGLREGCLLGDIEARDKVVYCDDYARREFWLRLQKAMAQKGITQ